MAASAAPASPLLRGSERTTPGLAGVVCGGRRSRVDRTTSAATSLRGAGSVHAGPMGLDTQCSSSGIPTAGAGVQVVRPQYADMGTPPFADTHDQDVQALISKLMQEMDEARAASSQISLERDEALARNECLTDYVDKVRRQRAGARPNELSNLALIRGAQH